MVLFTKLREAAPVYHASWPVRPSHMRARTCRFDIDMYDIRDNLIKPVIAHVEKEHGTGGEYSWTELVATQQQPPKVMFSHW